MKNTVTCSFTMDRNIYNAYKSIVVANGENVKGNLVRYMQSVIRLETPNAETVAAFEEGERMLYDPAAPRFSSVDELFADLETE